MSEPRWLDASQQRDWRAYVDGSVRLTEIMDRDLKTKHGLSVSEYEILVRLSENDGQMRMAHLANAMAHSRSRVTHTVSRLERAGLVARRNSKSDGRGVVATLTDEGKGLLTRAAPVHVTGVRDHLVDLATDEDFTALGRVMNAVADQLIVERPDFEMR